MPRTKLQTEQIKKERKESILYCAIEHFARRGYSATNVEDIAKQLGISVGLIYRYFSSKAQLYEEVVNLAISGLKEITAIVDSSDTPKQTMDFIAQTMLDELNNKEFIDINMMVLQISTIEGAPKFEDFLAYDKLMFEATARLIKKGQDEGVFRAGDPMKKSVFFFSSVLGLVVSKALYGDDYPLPTINELVACL